MRADPNTRQAHAPRDLPKEEQRGGQTVQFGGLEGRLIVYDLGVSPMRQWRIEGGVMHSSVGGFGPQGPMYWHLDFIVALARAFNPRVYMELGVRDADLFNRMIPIAEELIGVDINPSCENNILPSAKTRFVAMSTQEFASEL